LQIFFASSVADFFEPDVQPADGRGYVYWIRRYIVFHKKTHPASMGAPEISAFLTWLAVQQHVSASTQNQALSGLLFLYRHGLGIEVSAPCRNCSVTRTSRRRWCTYTS